ncbi:MAG TPA: DUF4252 domain-containing protein [Gammaproteobacteria bacterium]|nr:DUF4252 domain-containing protein [Gammaproteobacteria bacterium]
MNGRMGLFGSLMLLASSASAQGVFSFEGIPLRGEPSVEVNLDESMIKLLGGAAELTGFEGVTNVRVLVYENIAEDMQGVLKFVESTGTKLEGDGWRAVVRVREEGEQVRIYMKPGTDGTLSGVTVMITESGSNDGDDDGGGSGEAVFVNVSGNIRPEQLGQLASGIGVNGVLNGLPGLQPAAPARAQD